MAKKRAKRNPISDELKAILQIEPSSSLTNVCLASNGGENSLPIYQVINITDNVASEFQAVVGDVLKKLRRNVDNGNFSIRSYDAISKLDQHEIEHVDLSSYPHVQQQLIGLADLSQLRSFSQNDKDASALRFYSIVVEPDEGDPIYFFRSCSPKMELSQSKKFAIIFSKGNYDTFDESLFVFDRGIDCFCCGNDLYVLNKGRFEIIFQFFDEIKEAASETLETIRSTIPIHNFEELEASCLGHIQMLKKLKNIAGQPYLNRITMTDIKKVIKEMGLSLKVKEYDGEEKISFDSNDKWEILRLLDDDYLKSVMTGEKYEVNSKRTM